eukprot:TRINITY_DN7377_c0_g1_i1.p1 TRINITY_DN7377_c0_g1~~TRINITY_DN7377_c0_g1_i1.p1  ORF type:complete len:463 (+),score=49.02 TRINITY_DN7377_c0_g1_i1:24-1412(+)
MAPTSLIPNPMIGEKGRGQSAVVIGAGIYGLTAALELWSRGYDVTVVDKSDSFPNINSSSWDLSKMIRLDYAKDVMYTEMVERSLVGWREWNRTLFPRTLFHETGILVPSYKTLEPGSFEYESFHTIKERGHSVIRLTTPDARKQFPAWNLTENYPDGFYCSEGGWMESGYVLDSLRERLIAVGVQVHHSTALCGVLHHEDNDGEAKRVKGVLLQSVRDGSERTVLCDHVVVAAGAWTPELLAKLIPNEGSVIQSLMKCVAQVAMFFEPEDPSRFASSTSFPGYMACVSDSGFYGFPIIRHGGRGVDGRGSSQNTAKGDFLLKIGHHGRGVDVKADSPPDVKVEDIQEDFIAFAKKAFGRNEDGAEFGLKPIACRVCLYNDTVDGDFVIDRVPGYHGLVVATGGSGHGFKFGPILGDLVANAVEGKVHPRFKWRSRSNSSRLEAARATANLQGQDGTARSRL